MSITAKSTIAKIKAIEIIECSINAQWERHKKGQIYVDWFDFETLLRYVIKQEDIDDKKKLVFINEALAAYTLRGKENI